MREMPKWRLRELIYENGTSGKNSMCQFILAYAMNAFNFINVEFHVEKIETSTRGTTWDYYYANNLGKVGRHQAEPLYECIDNVVLRSFHEMVDEEYEWPEGVQEGIFAPGMLDYNHWGNRQYEEAAAIIGQELIELILEERELLKVPGSLANQRVEFFEREKRQKERRKTKTDDLPF